MDVVPMDLDQAELLASVGHAGRVSTALYSEMTRLRARVAELEAQQSEPTSTEWGVRWTDGPVYRYGGDSMSARAVVARYAHRVVAPELMVRDLGPWRVVSS
jgi:hypothetical protein